MDKFKAIVQSNEFKQAAFLFALLLLLAGYKFGIEGITE